MNIELSEALEILYTGQSNVALMAKRVGLPLSQLQELFRVYVSKNPIDPDIWQGDEDLSWPYVC
jgi:hypothetical protein